MAETNSIRAGSAFVEISTRNAGFLKGLAAASAKLRAWGDSVVGFGKRLALAGVAGGAAIASTLKVFASQGDQLAKASQRTGIMVEDLSRLKYAAEQSGASFEDLEISIRFLQKQGGNASVEGLMQIADELANIKDPGEKAARAMELFGRAGTKMIPLMADGGEGMRQLMERADALGLTMSGSAANAAVRFGDNVADLFAQVKKIAFEIGAALAPALTDLIGWLQQSLAGVIAWIKQNRQLIVGALKVAAAVTAAGAAIVGVGLALKATGIALAAAGIVISTLIAPVTILSTAFAALKAAVVLLLTPMGLVVAAFAGVVASSGVLGDAIKWLGDGFKVLKEDATTALDGIKAALSAGDVGKAAAVFWSFLKLEWAKGTAALSDIWFQFSTGFIEAVHATSNWFAKLFIGALAKVESAFSTWKRDALAGLNEIGRRLGIVSDTEASATDAVLVGDDNARQRAIADSVRQQFQMLDDEMKAAEKARVEAMNARTNTAAAELEAAQAELNRTVGDAKEAQAEMSRTFVDSSNLGSRGGGSIIDTMKDMSTRGIFNPRAIQSLQGSRENAVVKPIEKAIEKMVGGQDEAVNILKKIERNTEEGMAFA